MPLVAAEGPFKKNFSSLIGAARGSCRAAWRRRLTPATGSPRPARHTCWAAPRFLGEATRQLGPALFPAAENLSHDAGTGLNRGATTNVSPWTCGYSGFLEKSSFGWKVLNLQARGDVPDASEVAQLWKNCLATFFKIVGYLLWF